MATVSDDVCLKERPVAGRRSLRQPLQHRGHGVDQGTGPAPPAAGRRTVAGAGSVAPAWAEAAPRLLRSGPLRLAVRAFHQSWAAVVAVVFLLSFREKDWT
jgi:hypothetical protein